MLKLTEYLALFERFLYLAGSMNIRALSLFYRTLYFCNDPARQPADPLPELSIICSMRWISFVRTFTLVGGQKRM